MARSNSSGSTSRNRAKTLVIASLIQTSIGPSSRSTRVGGGVHGRGVRHVHRDGQTAAAGEVDLPGGAVQPLALPREDGDVVAADRRARGRPPGPAPPNRR